jgi:hypothetical protein
MVMVKVTPTLTFSWVIIENGFFLKHLDLENKRAYLENPERWAIAHTSFMLRKNKSKSIDKAAEKR